MTGRAFHHVAVLMGGLSAEREVSLVSGEACAVALESRGYRVSRVDVGRDLARVLGELRPDACFNALHGRYGEDGRIQGLLDLLAIPYSHSGVLASAMAMDKPVAKRLFTSEGMRCPDGIETSIAALARDGLPFAGPVVIKPAAEGSSIGVAILPDGNLEPVLTRNDIDRGQRVLVERYIAGKELTCAVLDGLPLTVTEIAPHEGFYDYRAKYTDGVAVHRVPAPIPGPVFDMVMDWAQRAYRTMGCRGVARSDFRWDPASGEDGLFLLEINTQPGMTPLSLAPEQAAYCGIPFAELVERLVREARCDR